MIDHKKVISMRLTKKTYQSIANHFAVSRERIHQIIKQHAPHLVGLAWTPSRVKFVHKTCPQCKKSMTLTSGQRKQVYCSKPCAGKAKSFMHNPYKKYTKEFDHFRYEWLKKNDPERLARYIKTFTQNKKRKYQTDPVFRAKQQAYLKNYYKTRS